MPKTVGETLMTTRGRREVIDSYRGRYQKASKREKRDILDTLVDITGHHRKSLSRALSRKPKRRTKRAAKRPGRPKIYTGVIGALETIWQTSNFLCGKRLKAAMPLFVESLLRHGEIKLSGRERELLLQMSASTMDRALTGARQRFKLKGRCSTKPGTLLKHQIPIRTFADWDDEEPGFLEIDLVSHCGGTARGEFVYSLTATDIATGWTLCDAFLGRGQKFCVEAIDRVRERLPFPLLGLDSDNGSEFINHHLKRYCDQHEITFTRGRPYKKNDQCHVEQKNWNVVRRFLGYGRLETQEQLSLTRDVHSLVELYQNFFQPSQKLIEKKRVGARVYRRHDSPATPAARLRNREDIGLGAKERLTELEYNLNPARLLRDIISKLDELKVLG